jgi:Ser/Thr protein kinase RdoA (MazF antagonist)
MRPEVMPARFEEALAAVGAYVGSLGSADDRAVYERVLALRGPVAAWCGELAATGGPLSLDHNDLHPWNVLAGPGGDPGRVRFYDWGDSVVAHPFASMLVPLGYLPQRLGLGLDHPRVLRLRDAYLGGFSDLGPRAELAATLRLACHVGKIARALTWHRSLSEQGYDQAGEFATAPLRNLGALLDDSYVGGA